MAYSVDIAVTCDGCGTELGRLAFTGTWGEVKQQATRPTLPDDAEKKRKRTYCTDCKEDA